MLNNAINLYEYNCYNIDYFPMCIKYLINYKIKLINEYLIVFEREMQEYNLN